MNIKTNVNSIKYKTLFYLIIFSLFILLLLWGSQTFLTSYLYEKYQINDTKRIVNEIKNTNSEELFSYLEDVVYNNAVCIEYIDELNHATLFNDRSTGCLLSRGRELDSAKKELIDTNEDSSSIIIDNKDYKSKALLYSIKVDNGYVYLYTMLKNTNKNDLLIKDQLIYLIFVIIVLAIFISFFLSKLISEPIVKITKKSKMVANGNYDVVFEKNGIKEIDELAETLNYLEHEVSKTDEYRRDLMANVSHDLKTPLTMIKAYAEMVRDISYKDKEKRSEHLNVIIAETDRLNTLVGDILTLSKLQANADLINIENFNLIEEINEIVKRYDILKETENYEIIVDAPKIVMISADKKKISQVIYNLVNNAINYTGKDKKVYIKVKEDKKYYTVEIQDTGKGIDQKELNYIWDKYYKNEKNHQRNKIGTGIGLSIVKGILEQHNFDYGVDSEKGKGTTFYFKFKKNNTKK